MHTHIYIYIYIHIPYLFASSSTEIVARRPTSRVLPGNMGHWDAWMHPANPCYLLKLVIWMLVADDPLDPHPNMLRSQVLAGNMGHWDAWGHPKDPCYLLNLSI